MEQTARTFLRDRRRLNIYSGIFLAVLFTTLGISALPGPATSSPATPVLLITVDTLRADHVGCYGARNVRTPAIDALASPGVRFEDALAQVPLTPPSHAVILSGTYPMWNGVRDFISPRLRPEVGLIAEAFERHGYATAAFVSAAVLDSSWGLKRGFQTYDDKFEAPAGTVNAPTLRRRAKGTVDRALAWFQAHPAGRAGARPTFVWLHLYDPHRPYDPPEPFRAQYASHPYDGQIAYADSQLGRLFNYLRKTGSYDQTLIVLLADHGESLGEHGEVEHGYFVYRSTLRVPLIFKLPRGAEGGGEARVIHAPVGTIDVAPTILELAHFQDPLSRQFQGVSLAGLASGRSTESERPVYSESYYEYNSFGWSPLRSLTTARYKYIAAPRPELYDITQDPSEKHNVYAQHSADGAAIRDQLLNLERRYTNTALSQNRTSPLPPETVEKLKSLGYTAYSAPAPTGSEKDLPDPKDRLQTYNSINRARELADAGDLDGSDERLRPLRATEPKLYIIPLMLGENALKEQRWPEAERELMASLKLNPSLEETMIGLAHATFHQGKLDQTRTWLDLDISMHPDGITADLAYDLRGEVEQAQKRWEEARRDFEKAVALKPEYMSAQQGLGIALVETRHYAAALKPLETARALGSDSPELFNALGAAYLNTDQPGQAIRYLGEALARKNDDKEARLNLALAYLKTGDHASALREFRSFCTQDSAKCRQYWTLFQ